MMDFNQKAYAKRADNITLSNTQKIDLVDKMRKANTKNIISFPAPKIKSKIRLKLTKAIAAVLALAVIGTGILTYNMLNPNYENSFIMSADAAEFKLKKGSVNFANYETGGTPVNYEDKSNRNWVSDYVLSKFKIQGRNIETVSFKLKDKGLFFDTEPDYNNVPEYDVNKEFDDEYLKWWEIKYREGIDKTYESRLPLTNSFLENPEESYTKDAYNFCDGFTVKTQENSHNLNSITLDNYVKIWAEPDLYDSSIKKLIDKFYVFYDRMEEIEKENYKKWVAEGMPDAAIKSTDEMIQLESKMDEMEKKIYRKTIVGKTMEIVVNYKDKTTETCILKLDLEYDKQGFPWLTGEISSIY